MLDFYIWYKVVIAKEFKTYGKERDRLTYDTTFLSPHTKFGTVSVREIYYAFKNNEMITRQLYWKDFYTTLGYYFPNFTKERIFQPQNKKVEWDNTNKKKLFLRLVGARIIF